MPYVPPSVMKISVSAFVQYLQNATDGNIQDVTYCNNISYLSGYELTIKCKKCGVSRVEYSYTGYIDNILEFIVQKHLHLRTSVVKGKTYPEEWLEGED